MAVIGTGIRATTAYIPALQASPHAALVALRDTDDTRLRTAAEHFGVSRIHTDVATLLRQERLDGAVVAVYHAAHYAVARACLCAVGYLLLDMIGGILVARRHGGHGETLGPVAPDQRYPHEAPSVNLMDVILGRAENRSPGEVGPRSVELREAAYHSAAHGGHPVAIGGDEP